MTRLRALDLFCGAGGVAKGLQRAGFYVVGYDVAPQRHYCGDEFYQGCALDAPLTGYDFIWASPPCQEHSLASLSQRKDGRVYADFISETRARLEKSGTPYAIENTPNAPLRVDLVLCGSYFGLQTIRHRIFELSFPLSTLLPPCSHPEDPITVCGHGTPSWMRARRGKNFTQQEKRDAMGIDWMNRGELAQAIPPAYSEFIGKQAIQFIHQCRLVQDELVSVRNGGRE